MKDGEIKKEVRKGYAAVAKKQSSCCGCGPGVCGSPDRAQAIGQQVGYTDEELGSAPDGANLGLGCGNPVALASLREGETVLDLGCGAGFDCFLAAQRVGKTGRVIGVDMTPEMLDRARENAEKGGYANVEFRLGEIENLPAADSTVDVVISNCVVNLSPDKKRVFQEAGRVLKPGGRLMVSDIVLLRELPDAVKKSVAAYVGCVAGASTRAEYLASIAAAGFKDISVVGETTFPVAAMSEDPTAQAIIKELKAPPGWLTSLADAVSSIKVHAVKPA